VRAFDIRRIAAEYESLYQQILIEKNEQNRVIISNLFRVNQQYSVTSTEVSIQIPPPTSKHTVKEIKSVPFK
jgi:hypothetical protein